MIIFQCPAGFETPEETKKLPVITSSDAIVTCYRDGFHSICFGSKDDKTLNGFHLSNLECVENMIRALAVIRIVLMEEKNETPESGGGNG